MIYKLSKDDSLLLSNLPETGLGYQVFMASTLNDNDLRAFIAFNSELVLDFSTNFPMEKKLITTKSYPFFFNKSRIVNLERNFIRILSKKELVDYVFVSTAKSNIFSNTFREDHISFKLDSGAINANDKEIEGHEMFIRVSAFKNDIRIDTVKKRLKANSFATTYFDYLTCVNCKLDPIDRYALPNDLTIEWAFYIQPSIGDTFKEGTVMPNFGRRGGGKEVYFEYGTSDESLIDTRSYGS